MLRSRRVHAVARGGCREMSWSVTSAHMRFEKTNPPCRRFSQVAQYEIVMIDRRLRAKHLFVASCLRGSFELFTDRWRDRNRAHRAVFDGAADAGRFAQGDALASQ